ncbi:MAG TPA: hypothetical protein VKP30_02050 [Polyangiaceae bacterium]|nr:hypothetical protein [Polyangiaceae bacterium]
MTPTLEEYEKLPFAVGQSPFKIKGNAYRGQIEYTNANVKGGMRAALDSLNDSAQREFFAQPFMASSFYDVYPLVVMAHVSARLNGVTFAELVRLRTVKQAEKDLTGVYHMLLRLVSPEIVATRLPQLTAQYFNFGTGKIAKREPGWVEAVRFGVPRGLVDWYGVVGQCYVTRALELNGARNPRALLSPPRKEGKAHGMDLFTMSFEYRWDP